MKHRARHGRSRGGLCDEWQEFYAFKCWALDNGWEPFRALVLVRRESSKDYGPSNCYWGSHREAVASKLDMVKYEGKQIYEWLRLMKQPEDKSHYMKLRRLFLEGFNASQASCILQAGDEYWGFYGPARRAEILKAIKAPKNC